MIKQTTVSNCIHTIEAAMPFASMLLSKTINNKHNPLHANTNTIIAVCTELPAQFVREEYETIGP